MPVYDKVSSVTLGSTTITTVQQITVNENRPLTPYGADGEVYAKNIIRGHASISGSITLGDNAQARALAGGSGTLGFTDEDCADGTDDTVAVSNVLIGNVVTSSNVGAASSSTVNFTAKSSDGTTSPVA